MACAAAAGVTVLAVTDHDTVAGCEPATNACAETGIEFVPGIEITAIPDGGPGGHVGDVDDIHVLGYFVDISFPGLQAFLAEQRRQRIERVRRVLERLAALGVDLDADEILRPAVENPRKSAGRPWIARALVAAGHASNTDEAFERWLGWGRPAFVHRPGVSPAEAISRIHDARGIASLAHPALIGHDEWIGGFVSDGLDALEAYHSAHDEVATARYLAMASALGVGVSGGSDYHGDRSHGPANPGAVSLPRAEYERLVRRRSG